MEIYRTMPSGVIGTVDGEEIVLSDYHLAGELLIASIQEAFDIAFGGDDWTISPEGAGIRFAPAVPRLFDYSLSPGWAWLTGETSLADTGVYYYDSPGYGLWEPQLAPLLSPAQRAWVRIKSEAAGEAPVARVLSTYTYFDLRLWIAPEELVDLRAITRGVFILRGSELAVWSELDATGYIPLRLLDPRGLEQARLKSPDSAEILEYSLSTVLVR